MTGLQEVVSDMIAEGNGVDALVSGLPPAKWDLETPAPGWTITHQIAHLTFIFQLAGTAAADPAAFQKMIAGVGNDLNGAVNAAVENYLDEPTALLSRWRKERAAAARALAAVPEAEAVPWLVRPLPPAILTCAGIMELFGHGQDIADALGVVREPSDRLRHLVGFAVLVQDFGYLARGLTAPKEEFRFEITAPSGELWAFGPEDSTQRISGPAMDFCQLVTRRRHRDDLAIVASGAEADSWLDIAQAYRGPAGPGRVPGQFS